MEQDWIKLGTAIKDSRVAQGMPQRALADASGQNLSTIQNLESARYGRGFSRAPVSLQPVVKALGWPEGKVEALLAGRDFSDADAARAETVSAEDLRQALVSAMVAATDNLTAAEIRDISQRTVDELSRRGLV